MCTNACSVAPRTAERRSRRRNSLRPRERSSPSTVCSSCSETNRRPSDQTTPPITAASRSSSFSAGGRRSTRAVTIPSTLSGSPRRPRRRRACARTPPHTAGCPPIARRPRGARVGRIAAQERLDEVSRLGGRERPERDGQRVPLAATPVRPALEQLRPRAADHEQRHALDEVDEAVDEVQQPVVGPVEVVHHEDKRAPLGERLQKDPPTCEELRPAVAELDVLRDQADERLEARRTQAPPPRARDRPQQSRASRP